MSEGQPHTGSEPEPSSQPTSGGGLFLRVVVAVGLVIAVVVGIVWYNSK